MPALALAAVSAAGCGSHPPETLTVITGSLPLYHLQNMNPRSDVSGAAYLPALDSVLLVDDGGSGNPPDYQPFYLMNPNGNFRLSPLSDQISKQHRGLEGTTFDGAHAYVTSALPSPTMFDSATGAFAPDPAATDPLLHNFSRFRFQDGVVVDPTAADTIAPGDALVGALRAFDPTWWAGVEKLGAKQGGLDVEGLAATPTADRLMFGLRSPHYGAPYRSATNLTGPLRSGEAIVIEVDVTTFSPATLSPRVHTIDLGGLGIRSMEYSATAAGYFLIAGIVEAVENVLDDSNDMKPDFDLYFWKGPGAVPIRVDLVEFPGLCRPEAVAEIVVEHRKYLFVASEESGDNCAEPVRPYNFLLIELNQPFLAKLK